MTNHAFKNIFDDEIKHMAKHCILSLPISMNHFCNNGDELRMWYSNNQIRFIHIDNSKPHHYAQMVNDNVVYKKFKEKNRGISYDYPFIIRKNPAKIKPIARGLFITGEYILVKESEDRVPDYDRIESYIYDALRQFGIIEN